MYCVKCGVELADSEKKCPLCGTPVFHPDIPRNLSEPPFPPDKRIRPEDVNRSGVLFVLTIAALLPALLCLLCDWRINGTLVWSGYAAGAIALLYVVILLPMWFRRPNPVIFVPVDFIAVDCTCSISTLPPAGTGSCPLHSRSQVRSACSSAQLLP